ncbi:uncharacterized protein LOC127291423 [Leptopilina boulardi]|uniref:uncharacterized protein LOC127291423 n=1 Tax=Leptopilina boulardi TaxID=63433 RepID=UPI0021F5F6FD|nr:uncharacterized protein LOC127291423 [Leptopilina boulardi]
MDIYKTDTFFKKVRPHLHIKICLKILRYMGTWPPETLGFPRILYFIYSFFSFLFVLGIYVFVEFMNIAVNYNDVNKLASGGPLFITNALNAYKFITFIRYHRRIYKLLSVIDSPIFTNDNIRYERIVSWYAWQGIFHYGFYQIFGFFAVFFWSFIPIAGILNGDEKKLPLDGWYPYDTTQSFAFIITWAHQAIAIILCCVNNLAIDSFIAGLINVASCQFEILKWNFTSIGNNIEEENISFNLKENENNNYRDKKINDQIRNCIEHNLAIFDFVNEIENIFSTVVGLQLLLSCFVICLSTFYLSQMTTFTPVELIANLGYVMCMTYQIFIYTFLGNDLSLQNENLSTAIYMGNWWKLNLSYQRDLYMIMIRTRRPLIVSTDFLIKLSIPTFMSFHLNLLIKMNVKKTEKILKPYFHLTISIRILRNMGTLPPKLSGFVRLMFLVYSFCFFMFTLGVYLFIEIVNIIINCNNLTKIASGVPLFITNFLHAYKFITIIWYQQRIHKLLSIIDSPIFSKDNVRYERVMSHFAWQGIFHHGVYQIIGILGVFFLACIPISSLVNDNERRLPLDGWYPYDTTKPIAFAITWAHQAVAIAMCCINNLAIDAFITGLINVACCQFELLKLNIASIGDNSEINNFSQNSDEKIDENFQDKKINDELRRCIEHNLTIYDFINEVQNLFCTVIGLQLFVNSLVICLSTYSLSQMTTFVPIEIIGYSGYTLCMTYQIFIYCHNGNELYLQNENLGTAIYMGNWLKLRTRFKRDLQIIMLRTQKPLIFYTDFLIKLTVQTFMSFKMDVLKAETKLKTVRPQLNIKICLKILRATGSWPPENSGFLRYVFYAYSLSIYSFTLGSFIATEIVNVIFNYNDFGKIASGVPLFLTNLLHSYKCFILFRNHRRLRKLLAILDSPIFAENNFRYKNIISWYSYQGMFHHAVFQIISLTAILFLSCTPIPSILNGEEKKLPLVGWYPYEISNSLNFILTWLQQTIAVSLCSINNIATDSFVAGLLNVAACQFELLKWNISAIGNNIEIQNQLSNSKEINQEDNIINEKLHRCIQHNLAIFEFIEEIQSIFSNVVAYQLIFNSFVICLTTYSVSQMPSSEYMGMIGQSAYIITMSYQILIYCWQGNELYLQNESLGTAIYIGNWWKLSLRNKRDLQFIMIRTRKPLIVTANFLIKLTIETFMSIMQTSYSMYALLRRRNT